MYKKEWNLGSVGLHGRTALAPTEVWSCQGKLCVTEAKGNFADPGLQGRRALVHGGPTEVWCRLCVKRKEAGVCGAKQNFSRQTEYIKMDVKAVKVSRFVLSRPAPAESRCV